MVECVFGVFDRVSRWSGTAEEARGRATLGEGVCCDAKVLTERIIHCFHPIADEGLASGAQGSRLIGCDDA